MRDDAFRRDRFIARSPRIQRDTLAARVPCTAAAEKEKKKRREKKTKGKRKTEREKVATSGASERRDRFVPENKGEL